MGRIAFGSCDVLQSYVPHCWNFKIIVDTSDWDTAVATNSPGQSGDPESPFYRNLYESWAKDSFFPVYFSKEKIIENADSRVIIRSAKE